MNVEMVTCVMIQNPETKEVLIQNRKRKYPGWSFPGGHVCDVWLFRQDFDIRDVVLQENETTDAKYATVEKIREMINSGEFIAFHYIEELFKKARN